MIRHSKTKLSTLILWAWQIMPIIIILVSSTSVASAASLEQRSLAIANNTPAAVTDYDLSFSLPITQTMGSIELQFCANSPIIGLPCNSPTNMNVSSAVVENETGINGFSLSSTSNSNTIILSGNPETVNAGVLSFNLSNITNPSVAGTFYGRIETFATSSPSGSPLDQGGLALEISNGYTISVTVPPYLLFCTAVTINGTSCPTNANNYINFGYLTPNSTVTAQSQALVATNAQNGYSIQVSGNSLTSGNNVLPALSNDANSIPGEDQFGINLVANQLPSIGSNASGPGSGGPTNGYNQANLFKFDNGDVIASSSTASSYRQYTISYIININKSQQPGVYSTTLTYIALGNF